MNNRKLGETMDKRSFRKHSIKEQDSSFREKYNILDEKYTKIKEILKQVLAELRELKLEKQSLITEQEKLVAEIKEKDELLERMQSVSEAVIDEYTALKVKCDLETEAANNAIKRATKYFHENQKLRRNTGRESESDIAGDDLNEILSQEPLLDANASELDVFNNLASDLRTEIASLKIQLSKEIEKQNSLKEDFEIAKNLYEQEMKDHNRTQEELRSLKLINNSKLEDEDIENNRCQNSVQSNQVEDTPTTKQNCEKVDHVENNDIIIANMESAEAQLAIYKQENEKLICKIQELENQIRKLNKEASASELLPIPPPPPPPPPPSFNPIKSLITFIHAGKKSSKTMKKENSDNPQQKAMSEMIDAIRKGNIQLKPTPKSVPLSPKKQVEETALGEMKNILASLKKKNSSGESTKSAELPHIHNESSIDFSDQDGTDVNIGSDIDDELKSLLRKQSIKILTNKMISDDGVEVEKNIEVSLQETATLIENQLASNVCDNSHPSPENEKNSEISKLESTTTNEILLADSVLSESSIMSLESEKSLEIPLQESTILDESLYTDNFSFNNSKMNGENETSIKIPLDKSISENQFADAISSENSRISVVKEKSLEIPLQESAAGDQSVDYVFSDDSRKSTEKEKSLEILLQEPTTENKRADLVISDNRKSAENGKCQGISLQESASINEPTDNVFLENNRKSADKEKNLEILFQEPITEKKPVDHISDNRSSFEKSEAIPLQESASKNQPTGNVLPDNTRKSAEIEKSPEISLQEPTIY